MSTRGRPSLRFFLDASVPDSVGTTFQGAGHVVIFHREALIESTKDEVVCATAIQNEAILVAVDKDMKQLSKRFGQTDDRFKRLNLVAIACGAVQAPKRLQEAMSFLEHEWAISETKVSRRLWCEVGSHRLTTYR